MPLSTADGKERVDERIDNTDNNQQVSNLACEEVCNSFIQTDAFLDIFVGA